MTLNTAQHVSNTSTFCVVLQAHLSTVYGGRSKVNNGTPRSMSKPPPWANLDPRVLSPIPNTKQREARWDDKFFKGNCLLRDEERFSQRCNNSASRLTSSGNRRRPASAGVRRTGHEADSSISHHKTNTAINVRRQQRRPSSANVRGREAGNTTADDVGSSSGGDGRGGCERKRDTRLCPTDDTVRGGIRRSSCYPSNNNVGGRGGGDNSIPRITTVTRHHHGSSLVESSSNGNTGYLPEERQIIDGDYTLNDKQETAFRTFVTMLADFDTSSAVRIVEDTFREAQVATGLQDFTGCGED